MRATCPVCSSSELAQLDEGFDVPILMNRLYPSCDEARAAPRGPLAFLGCRACGFVWNDAFDERRIVYDANYENDQTHSPAFSDHLHARARDVIAAVGEGAPIAFLEVGCGQGRFIVEVAQLAGDRLQSAEGFDPAWRGADGEGPVGSRIHTCYLGPETVGRLQRAPNVVATRHTIEHIPDPVAFLRTIRDALGPRSTARIFVETPCVEWILQHEAMQDFFYEHCSLFSAQSLAQALHRAGFVSPRVAHVFGGQYLWASAETSGIDDYTDHAQGGRLDRMQDARSAFVTRWREDLARRVTKGPIALWGAGAKGVNFALLIDPDATSIDHVIDINPAKQGLYLAGSGLPVVSPAQSALRNAAAIYVMNPNYFEEIKLIAARENMGAELVLIN